MKVLWIKILNPDDAHFYSGKIYPKEDDAGQYIEDEFGCQYSVTEEGLIDFKEEGWEIQVQYESIH